MFAASKASFWYFSRWHRTKNKTPPLPALVVSKKATSTSRSKTKLSFFRFLLRPHSFIYQQCLNRKATVAFRSCCSRAWWLARYWSSSHAFGSWSSWWPCTKWKLALRTWKLSLLLKIMAWWHQPLILVLSCHQKRLVICGNFLFWRDSKRNGHVLRDLPFRDKQLESIAITVSMLGEWHQCYQLWNFLLKLWNQQLRFLKMLCFSNFSERYVNVIK